MYYILYIRIIKTPQCFIQILSCGGILNQFQFNIKRNSSSLQIRDKKVIQPERSFKVCFIKRYFNNFLK